MQNLSYRILHAPGRLGDKARAQTWYDKSCTMIEVNSNVTVEVNSNVTVWRGYLELPIDVSEMVGRRVWG